MVIMINESSWYEDMKSTGKKVKGVDIVINDKDYGVEPSRIDYLINLVNKNYDKIMDKAAEDIMNKVIKENKLEAALKKYPTVESLRKHIKIIEALFMAKSNKLKHGRDELALYIDTTPAVDKKYHYEEYVSMYDGEFNIDYSVSWPMD